MHTLERYFSADKGMELSDGISEALLRTVIKNAEILIKDPNCYDARAEIMWSGSLSHNGLTGCGALGDWSCHELGFTPPSSFVITEALLISLPAAANVKTLPIGKHDLGTLFPS